MAQADGRPTLTPKVINRESRINGFYYDGGHPNDAGSTLMYRSFVPTLLEAIEAGKPHLVSRKSSQFATLTRFSLSGFSLSFTAPNDAPIHPWATGLWLRATNGSSPTGDVMVVNFANSSLGITLTEGKLQYQGMVVSNKIDDGLWHHIVLSHKWGLQETKLYLDATELTSQVLCL